MTLFELETLRDEADARIRLLRFPDAEGYFPAGDGEEYARNPDAHIGEKIALHGEVLRAQRTDAGMRYLVAPVGGGRAFIVTYNASEDEPARLTGDLVSVYGTFTGIAQGENIPGNALAVDARLVIAQIMTGQPLRAAPHAATRDDPAPLGVTARYGGSAFTQYAELEIELLTVHRGALALHEVKEASHYNITPPSGQEYLLVWVRVRANTAPYGLAELDNRDFTLVSASGKAYLPHFLLDSTQYLRGMASGGEQTALLSYLVDKGDRPLLAFHIQAQDALWLDVNARHPADIAGVSLEPLEMDDVDARVPQIKSLLMELGYITKPDNTQRFNAGLRAAVREYQAAMGLKATGVADEQILRLLLSGTYPPAGGK